MFAFRRKSAPVDFATVYDEVVETAPAAPRRDRLSLQTEASLFDRMVMPVASIASMSFCAFALVTSWYDPDYYSQKLIHSLMRPDLDPVQTATTSKAVGDSLPVPSISRAEPLKPSDYQIVTVFQNEAILATQTELMRVKVGSVLPGLGQIKSIAQDGPGGSLDTDFGMLKTVPN